MKHPYSEIAKDSFAIAVLAVIAFFAFCKWYSGV